jgi:alkylation response protein AidB-like acyl-CoA dehydrogenase
MDDDEAMLVATVREFVDKEVRPAVREVEHANEYPEAWIEQMKRIGIFGLAVPEEYGGTPVSMPCYVLVTQELARGWMSLAGALGGHTVVAKLLALFGTDEQQRNVIAAQLVSRGGLRRLASGQLWPCFSRFSSHKWPLDVTNRPRRPGPRSMRYQCPACDRRTPNTLCANALSAGSR